jgi:cell division protein FtsQ
MDPRIQARVLAVRREARRRRRRWLAVAAGLVLVVVGLVAVTRTPLLAVHHVRVTGAGQTTDAAVLAATGLGQRPLMIDVDTGRLRAEVLGLPWVATASVHRRWPTTVDIRLTERTPVAWAAAAAGGTALLDRSGRVLRVGAPAAGNPAAPPTITGIEPAGPAGSTLPQAPGVSDALLVAASLPGSIDPGPATQVRAIVVSGTSLQLALYSGPTVVLGTANELDQKLAALRTLLERVDLRGVATIDLRVPEEPVLTHASPSTTVSTTPRG